MSILNLYCLLLFRNFHDETISFLPGGAPDALRCLVPTKRTMPDPDPVARNDDVTKFGVEKGGRVTDRRTGLAPPSGYEAPRIPYEAPRSGYGAGRMRYEAPGSGYEASRIGDEAPRSRDPNAAYLERDASYRIRGGSYRRRGGS